MHSFQYGSQNIVMLHSLKGKHMPSICQTNSLFFSILKCKHHVRSMKAYRHSINRDHLSKLQLVTPEKLLLLH